MKWTSIVAIYVLFWSLSAFLVLPFGVRTHDELGLEKVPGQADSAPGNFKPLQVIIRTTILSAILFGLFYANYVYGWFDRNSLDFLFEN
jgi:predicted secreted protein